MDWPNKQNGQAKAFETGLNNGQGGAAWDMLSNLPLSDLVTKGIK